MIHLTYHYTDHGTRPKIFNDAGELILDGTVSPMRFREGAKLFIHAEDRQIHIVDRNGLKVLWTEGGETFLDLTGDIELFSSEGGAS